MTFRNRLIGALLFSVGVQTILNLSLLCVKIQDIALTAAYFISIICLLIILTIERFWGNKK